MPETTSGRIDRRAFMKAAGTFAVAAPVLALSNRTADGPESTSWKAVLVSDGEPGTPLVVRGRVFAADGRTPVEGATLHVYHTDARGLYSDWDGKGKEPEPRLKGWMKTDREGRYEFRTIRPASYPGTHRPQHVHAEVYGAGYAQRWIPEYWFADDPLVPPDKLAQYAGLGTFSPIVTPKRGADGALVCVRDIKLDKT